MADFSTHTHNCRKIKHDIWRFSDKESTNIPTNRLSFVFSMNTYNFNKSSISEIWLEGPKGKDHWEDLGVRGRTTLGCRLGSMGRTGVEWLRVGSK